MNENKSSSCKNLNWKNLKWTRQTLGAQNQKGMALMIAIFAVIVITYLVSEILYDTNVEYVVNSQAISRLKAYYAAKSGVSISLLRIKTFAKVQAQFGDKIPPQQKQLLDMIWSMPFAWPPKPPESVTTVDKELINDTIKESKMDATYLTTIADEGSRININMLNSPSKGLRDMTKDLLSQIFENRIKNDEEYARTHQDMPFQKIINNMIDWEDDDRVSLNGGDERSQFTNIKTEEQMPPNRWFRTVEEIKLIPGMTEEIFTQLKDQITVYGSVSVNPNYAPAGVLKAIDNTINDEVVSKILERRSNGEKGGPFKDANDFWSFVSQSGARVSDEVQKKLPLSFEQVFNFRIKSIGMYNNSTREIEAVVFDFSNVSQSLASSLQKEANQKAGFDPGKPQDNNKPSNKPNEPLPKGPPRIVYFIEH